jgi:phasin family protein
MAPSVTSKSKKKKTVAKKAAPLPLTAGKGATLTDFAKSFPQFQSFNIPQFQSFKMESPMMKNNKQFDKITQDSFMMGQDQMDAVMKSCTIWAKGMEDIMKICMDIATEAGEKTQNAAKTVMSCKTVNEFTEAQTKLAQASFDEFMTNATKISEKTVKLCTEAMEPINDQMGKTMKRATDSMAA